MNTMSKICWSCKDVGRGKWCQVCRPNLDCFGCPIPEGRLGAWVQTYTGRLIWPLSPRPEDIAIEDIAIGEARENRYGKQTLRPYKVAEHSVIVSILAGGFAEENNLPDDVKLALEREGLLHDVDEGILPDMPRPLKHDPGMELHRFRECGQLIQRAAFERFGVRSTKETHTIIDTIDKRLVIDETRQFMRRPELYLERHPNLEPIGITIPGLDEDGALALFLSRFAELWPDELTE